MVFKVALTNIIVNSFPWEFWRFRMFALSWPTGPMTTTDPSMKELFFFPQEDHFLRRLGQKLGRPIWTHPAAPHAFATTTG